jgi:heme/copper-type cytochrome/quinol oxidase subunit 2
MNSRVALLMIAVVCIFCFLPTIAWACPNCKEALAQDANAVNLVRGYYYSILLMLAMPFLILGGLSVYFYWLVRQARLRENVGAVAATNPSATYTYTSGRELGGV